MTEPFINTNFAIGSLTVTLNTGGSIAVSPQQIGQLEYREGLLAKFISVTLVIGDTTSGLTDLLQGMEKFELEFSDTLREITYEFTEGSDNGPLYAYVVHNKKVVDNIKTVVVELCRKDAIVSMQKRVCKKYKEIDAETLVGDIIKNELKSTKPIAATPSSNKITFIPPNSRPLDVLVWIRNKYFGDPKRGKYTSAGYLFYENYNQYHFRSIDDIAGVSGSSAEYTVATTPGGVQEIQTLQQVEFTKSIDMISNFDRGFYSGQIEFFDINNCTVTTKQYSLSEYYPTWTKISGNDELTTINAPALKKDLNTNVDITTNNLGDNQPAVELPYGTRNMFVTYSSDLFAFSDGEENVVDDPGGFVNSVSQSVSRLGLFYNQVLTATATVGNMGINVGNAVVVNFVSSEGEVDQSYSGRYIVSDLIHLYKKGEEKYKTYFTLVRDSFGI